MLFRFFVRFSFGAVLLLSGQSAYAQIAGQSPALQPPAIAAFQANPGQMLSQFPNGGRDLTKQVQDLVGSDKATLAAIIALAKNANNDQRKAIADGLAQAAKAYASGDPGFANQIQQSVASSGLPEFTKAYAEAAGDSGTAATGGGGGGSGGGPVAGPQSGGANSGSVASGSSSSVNSGSGLVGVSGLGNAAFSQVSAF
jgi:hypothetical protein